MKFKMYTTSGEPIPWLQPLVGLGPNYFKPEYEVELTALEELIEYLDRFADQRILVQKIQPINGDPPTYELEVYDDYRE